MVNNLTKRLQSPDSFVSLILGLAVILVVGTLVFNYVSGKREQSKVNQSQQEGQKSLPLTHAVAKGETLWSIAQTYYKNGYNWVDIQKANNLSNPEALEVGQSLTIPEVKPDATSSGEIASGSMTEVSPTPTQTIQTKVYRVVHGDNLWNIATAQYGSGYRWVDIARANNLVNPDLIHAGNVFTLP
ncbi:LysM peptidoglycan-binding domain-containing protein [Candidatus Gottesmanbacteria bacterium]|nr:LysM peptidoglycan-binding domain-containing protein [Candidatus Gottesmanbacteria bacterium]